jgi:molybdate transport system substrate-binding protein
VRNPQSCLRACAFVWFFFSMFFSNRALSDDLLVSSASSLSTVMNELVIEFRRQNRDIDLATNFSGSGTLLRQIQRGAPVDVFISADTETMQRAVDMRLIDEKTVTSIAGNKLVLVSTLGVESSGSTLDVLLNQSRSKIALGHPESVPAGRYAKLSMQSAGIWESIEGKLILTQNVRQSLDYVSRGEVDYAFVYATDATTRSNDINLLFEVETTEPIRYPIGVVSDSSNKAAAKKFIGFIKSARAREILVSNGFTVSGK